MSESGPLRFAFQTLWRLPMAALAESAWRWLYLLVALVAGAITVREVLAGVEISQAELVLASLYRQLLAGILISRALPLLVRAMVVLVPAMALLWVALASVSRAAILRALVAAESGEAVRPNWAGLVGVHAARVVLAVSAVLSMAGAAAWCFTVLPTTNGEEQVSSAPVILWFAMVALIWLAWSLVDWFLQLAPIFAVRDGRGMLAAVSDTVALVEARFASCLSISGWFSFWRSMLLMITVFVALVLVSAAGTSSTGAMIAIVIVLLGDSAVAGWLNVARLAAFVRLAGDDRFSAAEVPKFDGRNLPELGASI